MTPRPPPRPVPAAPAAQDPCDGVLVIDKPAGPTSHDVVDRVRRRFRFKKVGHGGTLDPQATGVLILLIGKGTKLSDRFIGSDKTYAGTLRLGIATHSHDAQGEVIAERDWSGVTRAQLDVEMQRLTGDRLQVPPMVSAVKVGGVPLYKRARKGQTVKRDPRLIHVYAFDMQTFDPPRATFILRCTKGTYVRSLCHEIGEVLGCGAHLEQLRRTQSGEIRIADALPLDRVLDMEREELCAQIRPVRTFTAR
jgi:tRNA pseudouridine55 synthase